MKYEIRFKPAFSTLFVTLSPGERIIAKAGAMASRDAQFTMKTEFAGGLGKGVGRMFAGKSLFISEFTTQEKRGELYLAPGVSGDIQHYYLDGSCNLMVQSSGFIACSSTVEIDTKFQGIRGFFSRESLFLIRAHGKGDFWFSSYGAIVEIPIEGEYIVAFEDSLDYNVEMLGGLSLRGLRTGIFGGEVLVCRFRGQEHL